MSDLAEFLDEALRPTGAPSDDQAASAQEGVDVDGDGGHPWQVEDEGAADWAARKVQQARADIAAKRAQRDLIVQQADAWLEQETALLDRRARFFEGRLIEWLRREIEADPRGKKSRVLPCGVKVARTAGRATVDVFDEAEFIAWAKATNHHVLVRTKESVDKQAVKAAAFDVLPISDSDAIEWQVDDGVLVTPDGEKVPGLAATTTPDSYRVDVGGAS